MQFSSFIIDYVLNTDTVSYALISYINLHQLETDNKTMYSIKIVEIARPHFISPNDLAKCKVSTANSTAHIAGFIAEQTLGQTKRFGHHLSNNAY